MKRKPLVGSRIALAYEAGHRRRKLRYQASYRNPSFWPDPEIAQRGMVNAINKKFITMNACPSPLGHHSSRRNSSHQTGTVSVPVESETAPGSLRWCDLRRTGFHFAENAATQLISLAPNVVCGAAPTARLRRFSFVTLTVAEP